MLVLARRVSFPLPVEYAFLISCERSKNPPVGKSGQGMWAISSSTVISGSSSWAITASMPSTRLCGGMLVASPTAIPDEPFTSRFGNLPGSTSGSLRVSSKLRPNLTVSLSISRSSSMAASVILASVYLMAAALSPSTEPKFP